MAARRPTFAFDLSKPLKRGNLLKQGAFHRAFKYRVFILYPGFLVYYKSENDWRLDLTKGDTLGNRVGAVKLKGASVGIARNAPKGCKFGLMVTAPDPANKRQDYLMNASSKEERDSWIEAIRRATPGSPRTPRSDKKIAQDKSAQDKDKLVQDKPTQDKDKLAESKEPTSQDEHLPTPPTQTLRQDTACEAATAAASCTDEKEEQKAIDEIIDSVNSSLKESEIAAELRRHNTATLAAISLAVPESLETELDKVAEIETSIDVILGASLKDEPSDDSSCGTDTPSTPNIASPTPDAMSPEPTDSTSDEQIQSPRDVSSEEVALDPEKAEKVAPDSEKEVAPDSEKEVAPDSEKEVAPDSEKEVAPDSEKEVAPDSEKEVAPDSEKEVAPDSKKEVAPDSEKDVAPDSEKEVAPDSEKEITPDPAEIMAESSDSSDSESEGKAVVTTIVRVTVDKPSSSQEDNQQDQEEEESGGLNQEAKRERSSSSHTIKVTDQDHTTFSVNLNAYDSDNTLSDEESHEDLADVLEQETGSGTTEKGTTGKGATENGATENGATENGTTEKNTTETTEKRTTENGTAEKNTTETTEKRTTENGTAEKGTTAADEANRKNSHGSNDSNSSGEGLLAPGKQPRRTSTPFVEKRGYLYKMGGQRKNWKLRYFVVRPGAFNYFKDNRMQKALGEVKLKNLSIFFPGIGERKQSFQFTVHTESSWNKRADYVLAGQSEREMKEWITAFKLAGQKIGPAASDDSDN